MVVSHGVALSDLDRYWLAGLLEGEGTFMAGPPSRPRQPVVALVMTDLDVVQRTARLWDRAVVVVRPRSARHKVAYATRVRGAAADAWMRGLYPLLGARRRKQVDAALAAPVAALRWRRPAARCATPLCDRRGAVRGLCRHHYKLWWKISKRGRTSCYEPIDAGPPIGRSGPDEVTAPAREPLWIAWLAGLLEGEGTFTSTATYPVISMQMCDLEVVQRAATILSIERVSRKDVERNRERGWSPAFYVAIGGARAAEWMRELRPAMGQRRASQIDHALAQYRPIRLTEAPPHCVVADCREPHRGRGLCHKHYMKWDRDRKAGGIPRITPLR